MATMLSALRLIIVINTPANCNFLLKIEFICYLYKSFFYKSFRTLPDENIFWTTIFQILHSWNFKNKIFKSNIIYNSPVPETTILHERKTN